MIRFGAVFPALPVATMACFCALALPAGADPAADGTPPEAGAPIPGQIPGQIPGTTPTVTIEAPAVEDKTPVAPVVQPAAADDDASKRQTPTDSATAEDQSTAPATTSALPDSAEADKPDANAATEAPASTEAVATTPASPPADPVIAAVRSKLDARESIEKAFPEQIDALKSFYAVRTEPLWIKGGRLSAKATAAIDEIKKADDYGLEATAFALPQLSAGADAAAQADAELKLAVAAMTYAHYARGGRINPLSLSNILDMKPPVKAPAVVLSELARASAPDEYLRNLHPKHPQFEKLRQALLKARGPQDEKVDEALEIKIPAGGTLKPGDEEPAVALLRQRLKVEAQPGANPHFYDAALELAVKAYQKDNRLRPDGIVGSGTRRVLNAEGDAAKSDPKRRVDRIVANMERWRWLPENLGEVYVVNNIPEFKSRIFKGHEELLEQKMIVGQPSWPTPVMAASMKTIVFHPSWGVPDGIKMKELLPRLKRAGGNNFFDQLFGGGSSGGGRVLRAYKLQPSLNGRPVDADAIDWSKVDIRRFSFVQPPGSQNPLGNVKFMFPNRHDVYMHDTPQRNLFAQSFRALSHGCMRLDEPRRTAEVLLAEDKGWSANKVDDMYDHSTNTVTLDKEIPVYLTYFTAAVDESGELQRFADIYGHDTRVSTALAGRPVRYTTPDSEELMAGGSDDIAPTVQRRQSKKKTASSGSNRPSQRTAADILADSLSGLLAN